MSEADVLFMDEPDEVEDDEPELIPYRANFSRAVFSTEYCSVSFEAPEGLTDNELNDMAWNAFDNDRYTEWHSGDYYDTEDVELDDVEVD